MKAIAVDDEIYMLETLQEAVNALMVLGYSAYEARQAVKFVSSKANQLEDIIKLALKELM